jgi:hypothetical protein
MIQSGSGLRFALKTRESLRIFGYVVGEEFQGNEAMKPGVFGFVNHAHTAAAKLFDDTIVRYGLADHGSSPSGVIILWAESGQVNSTELTRARTAGVLFELLLEGGKLLFQVGYFFSEGG